MSTPVNVAVIYYSSTGTITDLARAIAEDAEQAGAQVRLRRAAELAPQSAIDSNPAWAANIAATADIPEVSPDDMVWADAVIFGSPTRYGNITAQLKQFIDTLGGLWQPGQLADKVYSGFTASATAPRRPGVHAARALQHDPPLRRHPRHPRVHRPGRSSSTATRTAPRTCPGRATCRSAR